MRMRKVLLSFVAVLGLLLGLGGATAPASADVEPQTAGSYVAFVHRGGGVPATIDLYNTSNSGYEFTQSFNTTRYNVAKVCPKNENWFLLWYGPTGSFGQRSPGTCVVLTIPGRFEFGVYSADEWT